MPCARFMILLLACTVSAAAADGIATQDQDLVLKPSPTCPSFALDHPLARAQTDTPAHLSAELVLSADLVTHTQTAVTDSQRLSQILVCAADAVLMRLCAGAQQLATPPPLSSFQLVPAPHSRTSNQMHLSSDWRTWAALGAGYTRLF